jgi:hypothetical protein
MDRLNNWLEKNEPALRLAFRLALLVILYTQIEVLADAIAHLDITIGYLRPN